MRGTKGTGTPTIPAKILGLFLMLMLPILGFYLGFRSQPLSVVPPPIPSIPATPTPQPAIFNGSFEIYIAGAEAVLVDRQGRRTGFDNTTKIILTEIPESMYYDSKIVPYGARNDGTPARNLLLTNTQGGFYDLEIIPPTLTQLSVPFSISASGFGPDYNIQTASVSGTLQPSTPQKYHIDFDPGHVLQIRKLETERP